MLISFPSRMRSMLQQGAIYVALLHHHPIILGYDFPASLSSDYHQGRQRVPRSNPFLTTNGTTMDSIPPDGSSGADVWPSHDQLPQPEAITDHAALTAAALRVASYLPGVIAHLSSNEDDYDRVIALGLADATNDLIRELRVSGAL